VFKVFINKIFLQCFFQLYVSVLAMNHLQIITSGLPCKEKSDQPEDGS